MEKENPLLPFAFTRSNSAISNDVHLDTTPRPRSVRDENASSMYHTRTPDSSSKFNRPSISIAPSLKRRMGESFNEKDDVKRRVTAFDEIYSDEPTMIDTTSTDYIEDENYRRSFMDKEKHFEIPPSSPPVDTNLSSEYDPVSRFSIPLSPSQKLNSEVHSSPSKQIMKHDFGSETDFGIDKFNRFRPVDNQCPSTDRDITSSIVEKEEKLNFINAKAKDIVIDAFEEMKTTIDLQGMGLTEVPHEIKDLNDLVVFDETGLVLYQLYLTNNNIRSLSPALFKFTKLNVLSLRSNKLETLPALIKLLVNLTDLSIGSNRLKFLPWAILDLPALTTFRAGPNPYLKIPEDAVQVQSMTLNPVKNMKYVSKIKFFKPQDRMVASLKSICLSTIAKYDVSYQETKEWRRTVPKLYHGLIKHSIAQGNFKETCAECDRLITDPVAEVIEWWDFLQNKDIPFKREFCSGACTESYRKRMIEDVGDDL